MKNISLLLLPVAFLLGAHPAAAGPYVTSRWVNYSGPVTPCLQESRRVIEMRRLRIDRFGPNSVIGEAEGITMSVRCDAPGYAFVFFAFTDDAPSPVRERLADEVRDDLRHALSFGGGGRY